MAGTIIFIGANSSLAGPAIEYLLSSFPDYTAVLTVRDDSRSDENTNTLRATVARHPKAKVSIRALDLANLEAVHDFAKKVKDEVASGDLPLITSITCNAFYWNLKTAAEQTIDGIDKTFQVGFVSQVSIVLRLLGSMNPESGRIVFLGSENHEPGKAPFEKIPPHWPKDLDSMKAADGPSETDKLAKGFWRYSITKVMVIAYMYALNTYLEKDPKLNRITAVAMDPGALTDSRAYQTNTPMSLSVINRFVMRPFRPLLTITNPTMRTTSAAGPDLIKLATNSAHPGERGYFIHLNKASPTPEILDKENQQSLWAKTLEWTKVSQDDTVLSLEGSG